MSDHSNTDAAVAGGAHGLNQALEWHTSVWPLVLSVGILFLIPLPFISFFVYSSATAAIVSLGIGTPLTLLSIAGWVKEGLEDHHGYCEGLSIWAMPFFIMAEALLFVGFFAAYWVTRLQAPTWPPAGTPEMPVLIPLIMTAILVSSSITIHMAEQRMDRNDQAGFRLWLKITMVLGVVFLGFSAIEWSELFSHGFELKTNIYSTAFFTITGFHGSHVLVGLCIFLAILLPALKGTVNATFVRSASMYWHFVDIVWFFVVSQIYFW